MMAKTATCVDDVAYTVSLLPEGLRFEVPGGTMISEAVRSAGIYLSLPCGGKGTCGHCMVIANGIEVKACVTAIDRDMEVVVPAVVRLAGQKVLTDFRLYDPKDNKMPRVQRLTVSVAEPDLENPASDATRLCDAIAAELRSQSISDCQPASDCRPAGDCQQTSDCQSVNNDQPVSIRIEPDCLAQLPELLRKNNFTVSVNLFNEFNENGSLTVLSVSDSSDGPLYGVAVDIGTTTVAVALCDLITGEVVETVGCPNPQGAFGADIISRIVYTEENSDGTENLQGLILGAISASINTLARIKEIDATDIYLMTIAANTVMAHFLLGLPTYWLRREPYVPAATTYPIVKAAELNLPMLPVAPVLIIPGVSSYVGGDITAGVIASKIGQGDVEMLVDVGTNGEIVLAGEGFMVACSS